MKRKIISFGDKYTIYDSKDLKIGELNHSSFKHGIHELVYKDEAVDYVLKKIELLNCDYYLEKNGWFISPNDLSTEYKVFDVLSLIMVIERIISLKIVKSI